MVANKDKGASIELIKLISNEELAGSASNLGQFSVSNPEKYSEKGADLNVIVTVEDSEVIIKGPKFLRILHYFILCYNAVMI